jgi:hypothetical protein
VSAGAEVDRVEAVRLRLKYDYEFFAENAVVIINKRGERVPFRLKRAQRRLLRALMRQREVGQPQRAVALKARQVGVSTACQSMLTQRSTQFENHLALDLAQDRKTAGKLFKMGEFAHANLPAEIKPPVARKADTEDRKYMIFGEPSAQMRRQGLVGLNSSMEISTAAGLAGRGLTPRSLHISERAWWQQGDAILGVINGVPDDPDTLIVIESTAQGHNHFKDDWDLAVSGESGYYPFFSPWFEEEDYRRPFANRQDELEFEASVGHHPRWGADEPTLAALVRDSYLAWAEEDGQKKLEEEWLRLRVLQHLNWRRWAIAAKCQGKVDKFKQEYPSTPDEAFLSTGNRVFDAHSVAAVIKRCERESDPPVPTIAAPGPVVGCLRVVESRKGMDRAKNVIEVPVRVEWVPAARAGYDELCLWRLWAAPLRDRVDAEGGRVPDGQYVVFCDPASGETDDKGVMHAEHAIEVIDHRSRAQVAEWAAQMDPDLAALELLKAAIYFNGAWVNVERTGGYGLSMLRKVAIDYRWARTWTEKVKDKRTEKMQDRLGWSTDSVSKPLMEAELMELLRLEKDGIRSLALARQMLTFVRDDRGRTKPESGKLSDRLMAYMGAQITAKMRPVRPDEGAGSRKRPAKKRRPKRPKTGY